MLHLLGQGNCRQRLAGNVWLACALDAEHALEFVREHFDEPRQHLRPIVENHPRPWAAGQFGVAGDEIANKSSCLALNDWLKIHRREVAALLGEVHPLVKYIGDAAAHARGKIPAARAQYDDQAIRHIFAAVIADALHHRGCARITHGKTFPGDSIEESLAAGRAVEHDVADQNIFFGRNPELRGG